MRPVGSTDRIYVPLAAITLIGFLLALLPGGRLDLIEYIAAAALAISVLAWRAWEVHGDRPPYLASSILSLLSIGLLRDAAGGMLSGLGILVLLPVMWMALRGATRQMRITVALVAVTLITPQILSGAPAYPATGWRSTILLLALALILGESIQRLVRRLLERESEQALLLERLEVLAGTDTLTGVPNRRSWEQQIEHALAGDVGTIGGLCVALLDLDNFKALNDRGGHAAGDRILRACTAAWSQAMRPGDTLARVGGDEFAMVLLGCDHDEAEAVIDRLRAVTPEEVTISAGVAAYELGDTYDDLLDRADGALYAAKVAGRDRVVTHSRGR